MSIIVSPHPPLVITIRLDEQTGNLECKCSRDVPVFQMLLILSKLSSKFIEDALRQSRPVSSAEQPVSQA